MAKVLDKNLKKLPLGAIKPQGWLLSQVQNVSELQKKLAALPGLVKNGEWDGEEALPRYVRGLILLYSCLDDKNIFEKIKAYLSPILNSANEGGDFGPKNLRSDTPKIEAIKALLSYYELTNDKDVFAFLRKYFKNQFNTFSLYHNWHNSRARLLEELPAIEAVYRETDAEWLQDLALNLRESSSDWIKLARNFPYPQPYHKYISQKALRHVDKVVTQYREIDNGSRRKRAPKQEFIEKEWKKKSHQVAVQTDGVNLAKAVKYPAVYGRFVGDDYLKVYSLRLISSLEKHHGMPNGMFAADSRISGNLQERGVSTEAAVEMIESLVEVIRETRDFHAVDLLERIVYNTIGAAAFEDCSAIQDMQFVNQTIASEERELPNADMTNAYYLKKLTKGAVALLQAYPLYLQTACMTKDNELNFLTYTPCSMDLSIGGANLTISEKTSYPFRNTVVFKVEKADGEPEVKINFRVPKNTTMQLISGGQVVATSDKEISVKCILRVGSTFMLKMSIPLSVEENADKTVSLFKGNVLMSLKVHGDITANANDTRTLKVASRGKWNVAPILKKAPGGMALIEDEKTFVNDLKDKPLCYNESPFELQIKSKTVLNWDYDKQGFASVPKKSVFCEENLDKIYIPYGCTLLHVAKFPKCIRK